MALLDRWPMPGRRIRHLGFWLILFTILHGKVEGEFNHRAELAIHDS